MPYIILCLGLNPSMYFNNNDQIQKGVLISIVGAFFAVGVAAFAVAAESSNYLTEQDLLTDIPIVSGASQFRQRLQDAPSAVTIIDRDMIKASGALELVEVFRLVPGMFSYYVNGGRHSVANHAFADEYSPRLEIKVDGRSAYNPIYSSVEWTGLGVELQDIDYIEVIRGPNSPADGANAFQGAINIVTKSPVAEKGSSLRLEGGDINTRNASYIDSGTLGEIDYRATLRYRSNNGFSKFIPEYSGYKPHPTKNELTAQLLLENLDPNDPQLDHIDDTEVTSAGLRTTFIPDLNNRFDIDAGFSDGEIGIGGDGDDEGASFFRRNYESNFQSVIWTKTIDETSSIVTTGYRNYFKYNSGENILLSDFEPVVETAQRSKPQVTPQALLLSKGLYDQMLDTEEKGYSERYDIDSHWIKSFSTVRFSVGGQYRYDLIDSDKLLNNHDSVDEELSRAYANTEWKIFADTVFNAGFSSDNNSTIGADSTRRFSLTQHLSEAHSLRASTAQATRGPTNLEANARDFVYAQGETVLAAFQPDPDQREEELSVSDISYFGQFLNNRLNFSVRFFREDYEHIYGTIRQPRGQVPTIFNSNNRIKNYANSAKANNEGGEVELKYKSDNYLVALQYQSQNYEAETLTKIAITDINVLDKSMPAHSASILLGYLPANDWQFSANWYYQSQVGCYQPVFDDSDVCTEGKLVGKYAKGWFRGSFEDDHDRLDLRIARPFEINDTAATIAFIGHNVLNETYNEFHNFNEFEPRYYVQLTVNF